MNKFFKTAIVLLIFSQTFGQIVPVLDESKRWILVNNKIDKNEIFLTTYKPSKLRANTLVLSFVKNQIVYDYESNPNVAFNSGINYLDLNQAECTWSYDSLSQALTMTIVGGYASFDEFKFVREYKIESVNDGFILMKTKDISYENLKLKPQTSTAFKKPTIPKKIVEKPNSEPVVKTVLTKKIKSDSIKTVVKNKVYETAIASTQPIIPTETKAIEPIVIAAPVKIDYNVLNKDLFDISKKWILVRNKIERGDIYLTPYHESKLSINNLVLTLTQNGKIDYDYESDPKIKICLGVDFLDIDVDETTWNFDGENNIFTLTLKGGYASLDDFKFKRDYKVELFDDGFALRKVKEHYFTDFRKSTKAEKRKK